MRIQVWPVHGGYANSLLRGGHRYVIPDIDVGGARTGLMTGLPLVESVPAAALAAEPPDIVVIQRLEEIETCRELFGWLPGRDVPAIFIEHNTPRHDVPDSHHPLADRPDWLIVHVTALNALMWHTGSTPTAVIEHGVVDTGHRWSPELATAAFVANEPVRRLRAVGADLLPAVAGSVGVDVFGIDGDQLPPRHPSCNLNWAGNLDPDELHHQMARRAAYLHLTRWTSLGLSLIEAMMLGMPCVVLATTAGAGLPPEIGAVSIDLATLRRRLHELTVETALAERCSRVARDVALERFGLDRFLDDWDQTYLHCQENFSRRPGHRSAPAERSSLLRA